MAAGPTRTWTNWRGAKGVPKLAGTGGSAMVKVSVARDCVLTFLLRSTPALELSPVLPDTLESSSHGISHALESSFLDLVPECLSLTVLEFLSDGEWRALVPPKPEVLVTVMALALNVVLRTNYPLGACLYVTRRWVWFHGRPGQRNPSACLTWSNTAIWQWSRELLRGLRQNFSRSAITAGW
jgi:hypothetical protein